MMMKKKKNKKRPALEWERVKKLMNKWNEVFFDDEEMSELPDSMNWKKNEEKKSELKSQIT